MASFDKLKKYQRKKFDRYKELNEIKTKNDEAYIVLKVKDMESILSEFSSNDRPTLKTEFYELIETKASIIPLDLPLVLQIQNDNFNSSDKILIRKLIKNYFDLKKVSKEIEENALTRKARFLLTSGILCMCVSFVLWNISNLTFVNEMISVLSSFSIWEFGSLMLFEYDLIKEEIIKYNHLSKIRIIYDKEN